MTFESLITKVSNLPLFTISFLAAGGNVAQIRLQINRWVSDGKIIKLHKGLYTLSDTYRKVPCEPLCIANTLKQPSYISLQFALAWHGIIPEYVPQVTSITTGRPKVIVTPMGRFEFRHVSKRYFWGYHEVSLKFGQTAFVASPEKALIDLIYLTPGGDKFTFINELRLQHFEKINQTVLTEYVDKLKSPKLGRALKNISKVISEGEGVEI